MGAPFILVVDQAGERRGRLVEWLEFMGSYRVAVAEPCAWCDQVPEAAELAIALLAWEGGDSARLLAEIAGLRRQAPHASVILVGAEPDAATWEHPIQAHIPFPARYDEVVAALYRAEAWHRAWQQGGGRHPELARVLVGNTAAMHQVRRLIEQVAEAEANVLILGESGTGKEVVARCLHRLSSRRERAFVPVNCGAIPGDLLESELFGHEKGAFTGAISTRQGRFELAAGGTLFLDEIGDMPLPMQVKLLRVIQERVFERVGSSKTLSADVRLVAATHRNLEDNIREGGFREDLYYRLNVFPIELPPLRERQADIPLLIHEFIMRLERSGRGAVRLTPGAVASLAQYPWPGNVRELANLMERLAIMFPGGLVDVRDLPAKYQVEGARAIEVVLPPVPPMEAQPLPAVAPVAAGEALPAAGLDLKEHLAQLELRYIQQALDEAEGVVAHAAERLGMRRTTLVEKMKKYGIQREE